MLKLLSDENIFPSTLGLLRCHGLDVNDIKEMKLCGINDKEVMELARREDRLLITLDMHFSNIFLFPPSECPGIIVVRVRPTIPSKVDQAIKCFLQALHPEKVKNALTIVEENKFRIRK
jgi:predicted nuclease of predicted toxin-antitoxin system